MNAKPMPLFIRRSKTGSVSVGKEGSECNLTSRGTSVMIRLDDEEDEEIEDKPKSKGVKIRINGGIDKEKKPIWKGEEVVSICVRESRETDSGTCSDLDQRSPRGSDGSDASLTDSLSDPEVEAQHTDSFLRFHLNEKDFEENNKNGKSGDDETFAGTKWLLQGGDSSATIRSSRGTIRGVKNRVRAGIATFLQINTTKTWQEREAGKVVVYTTTMGIVRETFQRCLKVRHILRTNLVKYTEKDAFMSREVQAELKDRMGVNEIHLPQVFVEGIHVGDADTIEKLNESGELRKILKPYRSREACTTCNVCGGFRLLPCNVCNGSKKSVHRNQFSTELVALKCMHCDEVGLVKCYAC